MHLTVFYSLNSHHVSAAIAVIFRMILLQECKGTDVVSCVIVWILVCKTLVSPVLTHAAEKWSKTTIDERRPSVFEREQNKWSHMREKAVAGEIP